MEGMAPYITYFFAYVTLAPPQAARFPARGFPTTVLLRDKY